MARITQVVLPIVVVLFSFALHGCDPKEEKKKEGEKGEKAAALSGKISVLNANGAELTEEGFKEFSKRLIDTVKDDFITMVEVESFKMSKNQRSQIATKMAGLGVAVFESKRVDAMAFRDVIKSVFQFDENEAAWDSKKKINGNKRSNAAMYYVLAKVKKEYIIGNADLTEIGKNIQKYTVPDKFKDTTERKYDDREDGIQEVIDYMTKAYPKADYSFLNAWKEYAKEKQLTGFLRKAVGDDILVKIVKMREKEGHAYNYINMNRCTEYLGPISTITVTVADSAHTRLLEHRIKISGEDVTIPELNTLAGGFEYVGVQDNVKTVPIVLQNNGRDKALLFLGWHDKSKFLLGKEKKIKLQQYKDRTTMFLSMQWTKGIIVGGGDSNALGTQKIDEMVENGKQAEGSKDHEKDIARMKREAVELITSKKNYSPYWMEESGDQQDSEEQDKMKKYFKMRWKKFNFSSYTDKLKVLVSKGAEDDIKKVVKPDSPVANEAEMESWCEKSGKKKVVPDKIWLQFQGSAKEITKDEVKEDHHFREEDGENYLTPSHLVLDSDS